MVLRLSDEDAAVQLGAIEALRSEVKSLNTSLSSIPLGLKFLRRHYGGLKEAYASTAAHNKVLLADILSVLAMTVAEEDSLECLRFRLEGSQDTIDTWGHEYVRNLSAEIATEFAARSDAGKDVQDLLDLVAKIVPFNMRHNSEPEACDLLLEVERLRDVVQYSDEQNCERLCLYLLATARYCPEPEDREILRVVLEIYRTHNRLPGALVAALLLDDAKEAQALYAAAEGPTQLQLAFMLARHQGPAFEEEDERLLATLGNVQRHEFYKALGRDLDVLEPKAPRDIYKTHLLDNRHASSLAQTMVSSKQNLAATLVNAFVNLGFGTDALLKLHEEEASEASWVYKNKDHGRTTAAASAGLVYLWDVDEGVNRLDAFLEAEEEEIRAGGLLGVGLAHAGVRQPDVDMADLYLQDHLAEGPTRVRLAAVLGYGAAYGGTAREDLLQLLIPVLLEEAADMELVGAAALALGQIFVGTCNAEAAGAITEALMTRPEEDLKSPHARFLCLGLGLLYLAQQSRAEVTLATLSVLAEPIARYAQTTLETCAYAGSGDVLQVQKLLGACGEHLEKEAGDDAYQAVAVLGIALVAMGEELGAEMAIRSFNHLLQYGDTVIKRAVPLALGLLSISHPRLEVVDALSKLSHDTDADVAQSAILALGMVGAGTNNSRIAGLLRQLSAFYCTDANQLFMVRVAQGLLHLGKGLITLDPYHSHGMLMNKVAVAGLLAVLHTCLDFTNLIHGTAHHLLLLFGCAARPRMLLTLNEELEPLEVPVRVGQAVDTVGQAGRPKTITGFQTHSTPVLIAFKERAELATDEYLAYSPYMEDCVILRANPDFEQH